MYKTCDSRTRCNSNARGDELRAGTVASFFQRSTTSLHPRMNALGTTVTYISARPDRTVRTFSVVQSSECNYGVRNGKRSRVDRASAVMSRRRARSRLLPHRTWRFSVDRNYIITWNSNGKFLNTGWKFRYLSKHACAQRSDYRYGKFVYRVQWSVTVTRIIES